IPNNIFVIVISLISKEKNFKFMVQVSGGLEPHQPYPVCANGLYHQKDSVKKLTCIKNSNRYRWANQTVRVQTLCRVHLENQSRGSNLLLSAFGALINFEKIC